MTVRNGALFITLNVDSYKPVCLFICITCFMLMKHNIKNCGKSNQV